MISNRKRMIQKQILETQKNLERLTKIVKSRNKKIVKESENTNLEQAQIILATKDMVERVQKMTENIAKMSVEDVMPISDAMLTAFGTESSKTFSQKIDASITDAIDALKVLRDTINTQILRMEGKELPEEMPQNDMFDDDDDDDDDEDIEGDDEDLNNDDNDDDDDELDNEDLDDLFGGETSSSEPLGRARKESFENKKKIILCNSFLAKKLPKLKTINENLYNLALELSTYVEENIPEFSSDKLEVPRYDIQSIIYDSISNVNLDKNNDKLREFYSFFPNKISCRNFTRKFETLNEMLNVPKSNTVVLSENYVPEAETFWKMSIKFPLKERHNKETIEKFLNIVCEEYSRNIINENDSFSYDIVFSKDKEVLNSLLSILSEKFSIFDPIIEFDENDIIEDMSNVPSYSEADDNNQVLSSDPVVNSIDIIVDTPTETKVSKHVDINTKIQPFKLQDIRHVKVAYEEIPFHQSEVLSLLREKFGHNNGYGIFDDVFENDDLLWKLLLKILKEKKKMMEVLGKSGDVNNHHYQGLYKLHILSSADSINESTNTKTTLFTTLRLYNENMPLEISYMTNNNNEPENISIKNTDTGEIVVIDDLDQDEADQIIDLIYDDIENNADDNSDENIMEDFDAISRENNPCIIYNDYEDELTGEKKPLKVFYSLDRTSKYDVATSGIEGPWYGLEPSIDDVKLICVLNMPVIDASEYDTPISYDHIDYSDNIMQSLSANIKEKIKDYITNEISRVPVDDCAYGQDIIDYVQKDNVYDFNSIKEHIIRNNPDVGLYGKNGILSALNETLDTLVNKNILKKWDNPYEINDGYVYEKMSENYDIYVGSNHIGRILKYNDRLKIHFQNEGKSKLVNTLVEAEDFIDKKTKNIFGDILLVPISEEANNNLNSVANLIKQISANPTEREKLGKILTQNNTASSQEGDDNDNETNSTIKSTSPTGNRKAELEKTVGEIGKAIQAGKIR